LALNYTCNHIDSKAKCLFVYCRNINKDDVLILDSLNYIKGIFVVVYCAIAQHIMQMFTLHSTKQNSIRSTT